MTSWSNIKFFKPHEFDSSDLAGSGRNMDLQFVAGLDYVRRVVGVPMAINSGFRTEAHNKAVGGSPRSQHLLGRAADVPVLDAALRADMIDAANFIFKKSGNISRVFVYSNFLHFDRKEGIQKFQVHRGLY